MSNRYFLGLTLAKNLCWQTNSTQEISWFLVQKQRILVDLHLATELEHQVAVHPQPLADYQLRLVVDHRPCGTRVPIQGECPGISKNMCLLGGGGDDPHECVWGGGDGFCWCQSRPRLSVTGRGGGGVAQGLGGWLC